ncbi:PaaX family transcriptional regulator C-terminal domain-containing protein [Pontiella sulfatireligans]|uniref:Uncharacterized protein n=1 Tax=Pontiella sulfatireligans TaxID=2750658 RepID=A0A6C2UPC3_9BACT|nr:PaaX family transcriptional regulator C-terminal domain-containing protein [Pontiella sulfatireligans]VGO22150.1 hypothetical protein SCARR_04231 [Pontiella sulfatireligans]
MVHMRWVEFHDPNISLPVVKRRIGLELMEMLDLTATFLTQGGWGLLKKSCYPNEKAYWNAVYRLRKSGLAVTGQGGGRIPVLRLTEEGEGVLAAYFRPEKYWNRSWNGIWYLFVYDIPERNRVYRDGLRKYLKRLHMGCLQQSVWISPNDIRPEFDDLAKAAGVDSFAYLFESRTVLGLPNRRVVDDAWNFDRLNEIQQRYCDVFGENLDRLSSGVCDAEALAFLVRDELGAYRSAFVLDPLLPRVLRPSGYMGEKVYSLHNQIMHAVASRLENI